jgi:hypothetical protein
MVTIVVPAATPTGSDAVRHAPARRQAAPVGRSGAGAMTASRPPPDPASTADGIAAGWSFQTDHDRVEACVIHEPGIALRDVANRVGITYQAALRIMSDFADGAEGWTFLTEQAQVLVCVAHSRGITPDAVGGSTGFDLHRTNRILNELTDAGYVTRQRKKPADLYRVSREFRPPDPIVREQNIGELCEVLAGIRTGTTPRDVTPTR